MAPKRSPRSPCPSNEERASKQQGPPPHNRLVQRLPASRPASRLQPQAQVCRQASPPRGRVSAAAAAARPAGWPSCAPRPQQPSSRAAAPPALASAAPLPPRAPASLQQRHGHLPVACLLACSACSRAHRTACLRVCSRRLNLPPLETSSAKNTHLAASAAASAAARATSSSMAALAAAAAACLASSVCPCLRSFSLAFCRARFSACSNARRSVLARSARHVHTQTTQGRHSNRTVRSGRTFLAACAATRSSVSALGTPAAVQSHCSGAWPM